MRTLSGTLSAALLAAAALGTLGCGASATPKPATPLVAGTQVTPVAVSDEQFAQALVQILRTRDRTPERLSLLAGVVRRLFARAATRFDAGQPERGLAAVKGALYLIRAGEMRLEMLDPSAAKALDQAYNQVAQHGQEGAALAFLRLRGAALPPNDPAQARIQKHMSALAAWMKDTRQRSTVENASSDARAFGERSVLEPSPESLEEARIMAERWIDASLDFNANYRPGLRNSDRDEMVEAYRGIRTGAIVMAGLFLRNGDAQGATRALERSEARKVTSPELFERLQTAASLNDAGAWRDLAALYSRAASEGSEEELSMPPSIAEGAAWGAVLEAYRSEPTALATAGPLATLLPQLGMPEVSPLVLTGVMETTDDREVATTCLRVTAGIMLAEDGVHDYASVKRVFTASQQLLTIADQVQAKTPLDPSPSTLRLMMATLHVRNGDLAAARPMLEDALRREPSLSGYTSLASVLFQAQDHAGALAALDNGLKASDARDAPLGRADAHLLAFEINRARGNLEQARASLGAALSDALDARARSTSEVALTSAERLIARLAYHFGDRPAWDRAVGRMFRQAGADRRALSLALIETTSTALLYGDAKPSRDALERTLDAADEDDLVYAALWLQLTEQASHDRGNGTAKQALESIPESTTWAYQLAKWGLEQMSDPELTAKAQTLAEKTEAAFYVAMRQRVRGDAASRAELARVATGQAIDLVETHLARELTLSEPQQKWGPPPRALP